MDMVIPTNISNIIIEETIGPCRHKVLLMTIQLQLTFQFYFVLLLFKMDLPTILMIETILSMSAWEMQNIRCKKS